VKHERDKTLADKGIVWCTCGHAFSEKGFRIHCGMKNK
jgi:hypothetical protein